jgi:hypothetical protein
MNTAQFVNDLNVARFLEKLWSERDPATRVSLQRLLMEEDQFGRRAERLSNVHRHIADGRRRIELQKALIAKLKADGKDVSPAENTLNNLTETEKILEQYRQVVLDAIQRRRAIGKTPLLEERGQVRPPIGQFLK